jgi:predicted RNase H-like HicB family nuclease
MRLKVIIHEAEEGGYWAEVPALPGCYSQGDTVDEMLAHIREAIECHLDAPLPEIIPERASVEEVEI